MIMIVVHDDYLQVAYICGHREKNCTTGLFRRLLVILLLYYIMMIILLS